MRYFTTDNYAEEIDQLYTSFSTQTATDLPKLRESDDSAAVRQFVWDIFSRYVKDDSISNDTDFFELGLDSLKVAQISRDLQSALGSIKSRGKITTRILYENPSIDKLSSSIYELVNDQGKYLNGQARTTDARRVA